MTDLLEAAVMRERHNRRIVVMEQYSSFAKAFQCVVCGRLRADEESYDGESDVCKRCVKKAGLDVP